MKRVLFLIILVVILVACGQQNNCSSEKRHEGVIVNIEKATFNEEYFILTLPSVENLNFLDKTGDELIKLAQENDGAYYRLSQEEYEELGLEIGKRIVGYYCGVGESNPPVLLTDKVEVISQ
ncbi:hypothetical protein J2R98_000361 [Alkalibacillus filiformis]|uniref:DUF3221 domain-containing protein n=1 Tax=Alkalibacillus filiformis TaxID=200990 RepID=A0ABU0DQ31_9BACI|nr:hypothetical protein [Alkalibacillus filiformis]MDQ0350558.1 hypothetical protein [Alkalibacillus filiformis]